MEDPRFPRFVSFWPVRTLAPQKNRGLAPTQRLTADEPLALFRDPLTHWLFRQNRLTVNGRGSMCGVASFKISATSRPVPGDIDTPSMLCPAAITTFSMAGLRSMIGLPS